ncbi:MAG TPA: hypothetical protein ENF89_02060 [Candidatus Bathyarchaeota archaeon]|nr:hypothetical protein [Candidatus Bathyarchaeota archaeon]
MEAYELERGEGEAHIRLLRAGVRVVILRAGTFVDLQRGVEDLLGEEASAAFYDAGIKAGRNSTRVLREEWGVEGLEFLRLWGEFYASKGVGWFKLTQIQVDEERKKARLRVEQSFIAEEYGRSDRPICHFLCGFYSGVFQELYGGRWICEETRCRAQGAPYCEFKLERYDENL